MGYRFYGLLWVQRAVIGRKGFPMNNRSEILARESITAEEIFEQYYATSGMDKELVVELLLHISAELRIPVDKLRPSDRFAFELEPTKGNEWDSGYGVLLFELNRRAKKKKKELSAPIATIDDYIVAMSEVY